MSTPTAAADFLSLARKSGVIDEKKFLEQFPHPEDLPRDPHACAMALVRAGFLTSFQAQQLLAGKYRGFLLGPYKVLQPIGKGGMGAVFLGEHTGLKRRVALKVLPADKASEKLSLERFQREARASAALDHPNIVRLHDISQGCGVHFLVLEYVDGTDLQSLMAKTGPLHYAQAAQYIAQASAGLQHAHEKGFVHRDIKPANLMLAKDGTIKILDMGLTRSFLDEGDNLTGLLGDTSDVAGTADYIAPEQAMNKPVDERSDIYSLGATLFSLVTGHPPFKGSTAQKLMQHQIAEPPSLFKLRGVIPPALSDVVAKMMAKRPSERYQTATEVIDALGPWMPAPTTGNVVQDPLNTQDIRVSRSTTTIGTSPPTTVEKSLRPVDRLKALSPKQLALIGGGAAVGLILMFSLLIWAIFGGSKPDTESTTSQNPEFASRPTTPPGNTKTGNAGSATKTGNTTPRSRPSPRPAARTGNQLYTVDFSGIPLASQTLEPGRSHFIRNIDGVSLPEGVHINQWNMASSGLYSIANVGSVRAIGLKQLAGNQGVQVHFKCGGSLAGLASGQTATARLTYSLDGTGEGSTFVEITKQPYTKYGTTSLTPTNGAWQTIDITFIRPEESGEYDLVVRCEGQNGNLANGTIRVRSVEVFDGVPPSPGLYRADFSNMQPYKATIGASGVVSGTAPELPPGWRNEVWNQGSEGEFIGRTEDGQYVMLVSAILDKHAAQFAFDPKNAGLMILEPNRDYEARFEVRVDDGVTGYTTVQNVGGDWTQIATSNLSGTSGTWKTISVPFRLKPNQNPQFTVGPTITLPGKHIAIRGFEIHEPGAAATPPVASRVLYQLDLTGQQPFTDRGRRGENIPWQSTGKTGQGVLPPEWLGFPWHRDSEAEYTAREIDGRPALGFRTLSGLPTAMLFSPDIDLPTSPVRVHVEYRCESDVGGVLVRMFPKAPQEKPASDVRKLPTVDSTWQTAEFDVDLKGTTKALFEFHQYDTKPKTWIWIRAFTVSDPTAAPPPAQSARSPVAGKSVFALDLTAVKSFRSTFQDGQPNDSEWATRWPSGVYAHCWKKESVAEFRVDMTDRSPALGITNLNDALSSQILIQLEGPQKVTLEPNKEYLVKVEYRALNDAVGKFWARLPGPDYTNIATAELAVTNGQWKTMEFTFRRGDKPIELGLENTAVGEGNTLFVRSAEVFEVKK